ncbi:hypothetical protein HDV00_005443 [Rhizophlyctis rosea]|nr:hypothetical protein HDV00_005443 [Rhizophlyctis rosea]
MAIRGPIPIPYFTETGWYTAYDQMGEELPSTSPIILQSLHQTRNMLKSFLLTHILSSQTSSSQPGPNRWPARKVFLMGFSQGGAAALDFSFFGEVDGLGGVVSISGWPAVEWYGGTSLERGNKDVKVLITQGKRDEVVAADIVAERLAFLNPLIDKPNLQVTYIEGKGHSMPATEIEVREIMKFFSTNLFLRNIALETTPGIYEVK